jgi:uncharacterized protein (DUF924 family)
MAPDTVLDYWFGDARERPATLHEQRRLWFGSETDTAADVDRRDTDLRARFGETVALAADGQLDGWSTTPAGRLALVLLLDQLPRNIFRGTARAFATDAAARALTLDGLERGLDRALQPLERVFFYLPLEHAESLADQDRCVDLFTTLEADAPAGLEETFAGFTRYARWHRDIIARFGRFPHRNRALGRPDTPAEEAYLAGDAPGFGQL